MNIEKTKLKKYILIILLITITITILPIFISSLAINSYGYSFKSISGKTWNNTEDIAGLYEYLYNKTTGSNPSIPSYNELKDAGFGINHVFSATSDNVTSFNRLGCLGDHGTKDWAVNMICYHPLTSTWDYGRQKIQQVIIINNEKIEFRKLGSGVAEEELDEDGESDSNYNYQKFLSVAYKSQSNYAAAVHFQQYLSHSQRWSDAIKADTGLSVECDKSDTGVTLDWARHGDDVKTHKYSGIFVFFSCGGSGIQGRVMYRVVKEESTPEIDLKINKTKQDGTTALTGSTIKVNANYSGSNVKSMFQNEIKINGKSIDLKDGASWDLTLVPEDYTKPVKVKVTETGIPGGYIGVSGEHEITINYNSTGNITGISGGTNKVVVGGTNTDTATITIKNTEAPKVEFTLKKVDFKGNLIDSSKGAIIKMSTAYKIQNAAGNVLTNSELYNLSLGQTKIIITPFGTADNQDTNTIQFTLYETTAPTGFVRMTGGIILELTYKVSTGKITGVKVIQGSSNYIDVEKTGTEITAIRLKNVPIPPAVNIVKKDFNGNNISNAEFDIYLNNAKEFTIGNKRFDLSAYKASRDPNNDGNYSELSIAKNQSGNETGYDLFMPGSTDWNRIWIRKVRPGIEIKNLIPCANDVKQIIMTLEEVSNLSGYDKIPQRLSLNYVFENGEWKLEARDAARNETLGITDSDINSNRLDSAYFNINNGTVTIKDDYKIDNLNISKLDESTSEILANSKFNIVLKGFRKLGSTEINSNGYAISSNTIRTAGLDSIYNNGEITLRDLVFEKGQSSATIEIEEIEAPVGYKRIEGKITITITRNGDNYSYTITKSADGNGKNNVLTREFNDNSITNNGNDVSITLKNIPIMTLGGIVWEDAQTGDKNAQGYDSIYTVGGNSQDAGKENIKVELYKADGTKVESDIYGNSLMTASSQGENKSYLKCNGREGTITLSKGQYVFPNIEKGNYYVRFTYDGIHYKTVNLADNVYENNNRSKVTEEGRDTFNAKFATIQDDTSKADTTSNSYGKTGTDIELTYNNNNSGNVKTSNIQMNNEMYITAKTANYLNSGDNWIDTCWNSDGTIKDDSYANDINCGLVRKELDLGAYMSVDSTTLEINDKTTKYDYSKSLAENLKNAGFTSKLEENMNGVVQTYLEYSDYYYRIGDYNNSQNSMNDVNDAQEDLNGIIGDTETEDELNVFVTYKVELYNQVLQPDVRVNELAYYYDPKYELVAIGNTIDATTGKAIDVSSITRGNPEDVLGKKKIMVSNFGVESNSTEGNIQNLYFTFKINKENNTLPIEITSQEGLNCANIVEITSYTTTDSLIDNDSAPGNAIIGNSLRVEDDTSKSNGLKITIKETERSISGTVFEDIDKEGTFGSADTAINNVIVQLIEIRTRASGGLGEYIWQETVSGSNKVKTTTRNGYEGVEYTNSVQAGSGQYEFKGFVPGNYIIRYIYGDGRTYDFDAKYNGQDYKSTKDPKYNVEIFNTAIAEYADNSSVARDNEARRLEVMAFTTNIDGGLGTVLNVFAEKKEFNNLSSEEKKLVNKYYKSLKDTGNSQEINYIFEGDMYKAHAFKAELDAEEYNKLIKYISYKTWMCAETSRINVPVDAENLQINTDSTTVGLNYETSRVVFNKVNFGLALRPKTDIRIEKHITGLKITPDGTGSQSIIDAKADIAKMLSDRNITTTGLTTGLATNISTTENRGFWLVATDVEELAQGAQLEVEYTYVIRNDGEKDYLSTTLMEQYVDGIENGNYKNFLVTKSTELKDALKGHTDRYKSYLGDFYYTGNEPRANDSEQSQVLSRIEKNGLEEALNNDLKFDNTTKDFITNETNATRLIYNAKGEPVQTTIETTVRNKDESAFLKNGENDHSKTIKLKTVLSSTSGGELGANLPTYIAEVMKYSNAAGRRDTNSIPENLSYVHSDDNSKTVKDYNENDEFWGESIIITKPTGEDRITPVKIAIVTIAALATLGVGIVLIKKFVLKK